MKRLEDMTSEELWELFPIILTAHDDRWKQWAADEIAYLSEILQGCTLAISHIGSTAIEGILAKPTIDILAELKEGFSLSDAKERIVSAGYRLMSESGTRMSFNKGYTPQGFARQVFHLHLRCLGDWDELYFRDYLRAHRETAQEYAALKRALAGPYRHDRDGYTRQKGDFVRRVTALARAEFPGRYAGCAASQAAADGRK